MGLVIPDPVDPLLIIRLHRECPHLGLQQVFSPLDSSILPTNLKFYINRLLYGNIKKLAFQVMDQPFLRLLLLEHLPHTLLQAELFLLEARPGYR